MNFVTWNRNCIPNAGPDSEGKLNASPDAKFTLLIVAVCYVVFNMFSWRWSVEIRTSYFICHKSDSMVQQIGLKTIFPPSPPSEVCFSSYDMSKFTPHVPSLTSFPRHLFFSLFLSSFLLFYLPFFSIFSFLFYDFFPQITSVDSLPLPPPVFSNIYTPAGILKYSTSYKSSVSREIRI